MRVQKRNYANQDIDCLRRRSAARRRAASRRPTPPQPTHLFQYVIVITDRHGAGRSARAGWRWARRWRAACATAAGAAARASRPAPPPPLPPPPQHCAVTQGLPIIVD
ncbi:unnamed protein product [Colias eurytheme]|nr:unnamed protein product [Colias eurytheme]